MNINNTPTTQPSTNPVYTLTINNYQIIRNATLEFPTGLTLITGPSNNGKSSIIKAFKQLVYNTPSTKFISHNKKQSTITLTTPSNTTITYTATPSHKQYTYTTPSNPTPIPLHNPGSQQPHQISDLTHINKQLNLNFWDQLTQPVLISQSPQQQFTLINHNPTSIHIQNILTTLRQDTHTTNQHITSTQAQLDILHNQNTQFTQQLHTLPTLTTIHTTLSQLKTQHTTLQQLQSILQQYTSINTSHIQHQLTSLQHIPSLSQLTTTHSTLTKITNLYQQLLKTTNPINTITNQIRTTTHQIDSLNQFTSTHFTTCPLCNQPFNPNIHITH